MTRVYAAKGLEWKANRLVVQGGGRHSPVAVIVPDTRWPGMWRVQRPDGTVTDMVNLARARDAARTILLAALNCQETAPGARPFVLGARPKSDSRKRQAASWAKCCDDYGFEPKVSR